MRTELASFSVFVDLERLGAEEDPRRRGRELEKVLQTLFEHSNFDVLRNAGAAKPRQTDVMATDGDDYYLIEAKWTSRPANISAVAGLRDRLGRTQASTIGVLVSVSGFTPQAIAEAEQHRRQPILLFDGDDLDQVANR
jgi:Restriction endonuclease